MALTFSVTAPLAPSFALSTGTLVLDTASGKHSFNIELATTDEERALGLMYRRSLPADSGMLFLYTAPRQIFMWMKNTYIPLDMVFIDAWGQVHRIEANTQPFSLDPISSDGDVLAVLELKAGTSAAIGLKPGDKVIYPGLGQEPKH